MNKGEGRNSWQWVKHAWLYSDLQALKGEHLSALGSQQRGPSFLHPHCRIQSRERILKTMMVTGSGRSILEQGRKFWQWVEHTWLYSDLFQALKGEHLSALGN